MAPVRYTVMVNGLTVQETRVLILVIALLGIGEIVKIYRASHPPVMVNQAAKS